MSLKNRNIASSSDVSFDLAITNRGANDSAVARIKAIEYPTIVYVLLSSVMRRSLKVNNALNERAKMGIAQSVQKGHFCCVPIKLTAKTATVVMVAAKAIRSKKRFPLCFALSDCSL